MKEQDDILLWKYLDGSLSDMEIQEVNRRLSDDTSFKALFHEISTLDSDLKSYVDDAPSDEFRHQLLYRLPKKTAKKVKPYAQGISWRFSIVFVTVLSMMIALFLLTLGPGDEFSAANAQGEEVLEQHSFIGPLIWTGYAVTILVILDFLMQRRYHS